MSLAPQELENSASKYAAEAIKFDSQGSRALAIQAYQRAVEVLVKLIQLYPDYKLNKIYMQRASNYQNRIKTLQMPSNITGSHNAQNVPRIKSSEQLRPDSRTSNGGKVEDVTENLGSVSRDVI